jgi:serine/threonine protein kinase
VFLCAQGTIVAIKLLLSNDPLTVERFLKEVSLLAGLWKSCPSVRPSVSQPAMPIRPSTPQRSVGGSMPVKPLCPSLLLLPGLRHPNLLLFMGFTIYPAPVILSEFMQRGSLFKIMRKRCGVPLDAKLQRSVALSVARGMDYLHQHRPPILHLVRSLGAGYGSMRCLDEPSEVGLFH